MIKTKTLKIGLWSDSHNFPSVPLMKISAYHKNHGDDVEMFMNINQYDCVYASKVFSFTNDIDEYDVVMADEIKKGGTGYCITLKDGKEVFDTSKNIPLQQDIESTYPDYSLYPQYKFCVGFLTRGCPRKCGFCVVGKKEGLCSHQVAEVSDFYRGEYDTIKLLDPNILACREHLKLLDDLYKTNAWIDFTQGLDIRLTNDDNIKLLSKLKVKCLHFAWDNPKQDLTKYFKNFSEKSGIKGYKKKSVYVLTNFNSTIEEDLYRIYTLRDLDYNPYVMIYDKEHCDQAYKDLQRWCNNRIIFRSTQKFEEYKRGK